MAFLTGLHQRAGIYHLRVIVPTSLRARLGRSCIRKSLGTSDRAEAAVRGTIERAKLLALFASAQKNTNACIPTLSEALQQDLKPLMELPPPLPAATDKAALPATGTPLFLKAPTLRELYARWLKVKQRARSSEQACLLAIATCETALGKLPIDQLTRAHGDAFRAWLQEQPLSNKTARDRLTWVKSLLVYAYRELELIPRQPWEGLDIEVQKTPTRRAWKDTELQQLFTQPLFQAYDTPKGRDTGSDAAYWIPLLGLYTGARIGELAQLRPSDITTEDGTPILRISADEDGQRIKTSASYRAIPIHSELVRLGFLDYAEAIRKAGHESLWPVLRVNPERPGLVISNWFGKYRRGIGLTDLYPDFHFFRHLVRTRMSKGKVLEKVQDAVTGHETQGSIGTKIYQGIDLDDRLAAIQTLSYPFLSLPRTYTLPKMETAQRGRKACTPRD